jgi:NAD(P)-dependent dehydrogenase (short-subunit alcohol dehydrogenase family)
VRSHGRKAVVKQLDYTDLPSCSVTVDLLIDDLGGLDVFVNNVGTGGSTLLVDTSYDEWRKIIATNLDGTFVCMRQAAKHMIKAGNGGRLIAVTSVHEHQPRVGSGPYDAAKHGP